MTRETTSISFARTSLTVDGRAYDYFSIMKLEEAGWGHVSKLPYCIRVLLEAAVRTFDGASVTREHIERLARWNECRDPNQEIPLKPTRILLHDTTGLPTLVDLAAMREAVHRHGGNPRLVNPVIPVDLVVDHSLTVDAFGTPDALERNEDMEFQRNAERYRFFKWAQGAFENMNIVPPSTGIMHQINMELLSSVVSCTSEDGKEILYPDSLVGTDSHTTMINGMGIVAWGVGGIEAEAAMLGQPLYFATPDVVGFRLTGKLPEGATATDLALTITELLRKKGVVVKFVEYFGPGVRNMSVADRATVANMAPEYGATMGFFPVDDQTLRYLRSIGKSDEQISVIEAYYKAQGMFAAGEEEPDYPDIVELDLSKVVPSLAGPKRPQDRVEVPDVQPAFRRDLTAPVANGGFATPSERAALEIPVVHTNGKHSILKHGSIVLAAITSCTNTSNPDVLIAAGLFAKRAVERGLRKPEYVKSSLTPGSRVVADYLSQSGLLADFEQLGFHIAGFGCATCIGNSGPLPDEIAKAIVDNDLVAAAVLSGNRNFEGRIHPQIKANYLASPPLVIAYALAGTIDIDLTKDPLGIGSDGAPVYFRDLWPSGDEVRRWVARWNEPELYRSRYRSVYEENKRWNRIQAGDGERYDWEPESTYIQEPPFLHEFTKEPGTIRDVRGVRVLALLGDSVTTDHASPSGAITPGSPAGRYLTERGVQRSMFNSYPSRRGNHEVMMRGTFANVRIRNLLVPGSEGGVTKVLPSGEITTIYEAALQYKSAGIDLAVIAGKEYGTGSSRDWAAKGPYLLGVKFVLAESFERIHRSNLVNMGILPLQFKKGDNAAVLGLTGLETFQTVGLHDAVKPGETIGIRGARQDGSEIEFDVTLRLDNVIELEYYRNGGIMQTVVRKIVT